MGLVDDFHGVLLVFSLAGEGELVLRLAIGDLVDPSKGNGMSHIVKWSAYSPHLNHSLVALMRPGK